MYVYFDIQHFYYLPQYLPVSTALNKRGISCKFVIYKQELLDDVVHNFAEKNQLTVIKVNDEKDARILYEIDKPDWIIFGNSFTSLKQINQFSRTAMMQHGIGPKACYYDVSSSEVRYRFVEGQHRLARLKEMFPDKHFIDTGYAKLDPIVNQSLDKIDLTMLGLDPNKKTLLYAPTYYPSSIEKLPFDFPSKLEAFNLIVKPHYFSLIKRKYRQQQKRFSHWKKYPNVYLADVDEISILPFLDVADLLISDTSSTLFEFTALNKPAIWCDFFKVRWSYRGFFKWRLSKRLDQDIQYFDKVATRVTNLQELLSQIVIQINHPELKAPQRLEMTEQLTGKVDGLCSERIANFMIAVSQKEA